MSEQQIQSYLNEIKCEGKSSPAGMYWDDFFALLRRFKKADKTDPPVPLILAASGESDASKYFRFSQQLEWALQYDCLNEAFEFLNNLELDQWNRCSQNDWHKTSYWAAD